jgi:hypothetical protein
VVRSISPAEHVWLAAQVTGIEVTVLAKAAHIDVTDAALQAPFASIGGVECQITRDHARPTSSARPPARCARHRLVP